MSISHNRASQSLFRHLAYDLDQALTQNAALRQEQAVAVAAPIVHDSFKSRGVLLALETAGPLGDAGSTVLLPDDEIISPFVKGHSGWDLANLELFGARVSPDKAYTLLDVGANIGLFSRQLVLGDNLDLDRVQASYEAGVLRLQVPVAEKAKPRKIEVTSSESQSAISV